MKKTIIFITILSLVFGLSGCQRRNDNPDVSTATEYSDDTNKNILSEDESLANGANQIGNAFSGTTLYADWSFEEYLRQCTDAVTARYIGIDRLGEVGGYLEFEIIERILGEDNGKTLVASFWDENVSFINGESEPYAIGDFKYQEGKEYLLILGRSIIIYREGDGDIYSIYNTVYLPLEEMGACTMYGDSISKRSEIGYTPEKVTREELIDYVRENTKNNTERYSYGNDYIRSDKIEDIINESPLVLRILLKEENVGTRWFSCYGKVLEVLKGEIGKQNIDDIIDEHGVLDGRKERIKEHICEFTFFPDTVKIGDEVIVAVNDRGGALLGGWLPLSSKNSVFRLDQYDEIMAIIKG